METLYMRTERKGTAWWITNIPDCDDCGPYDRKDDAEDDRRGLERFYKYHEEPGFIAGEKCREV